MGLDMVAMVFIQILRVLLLREVAVAVAVFLAQ
jgi:hypothetical protein